MQSGPSIVSISLLMTAVAGVFTARPVAAADTPVASASLAIRNRSDPGDPSARKIKWSVRDAAVVAGPRGTADDPRCIGAGGGGAGGSIRVFSDRSESSTEDTGDISLPCANWRASSTGYVYVDGHHTAGPCSRVVVATGEGVKATCTGTHASLDYDLTIGVDQGNVGIALRVGADDRWCGSVDASNGKDGSDGRTFQGRRAPAPAACPIPFVCGDGHLVAGEECDDGNLTTGDGCNASCRVEDGYACTGDPSVCALVCSDGNLDPGETCDDGNLVDGDGCDATCQVEDRYACTGEPSVCALICSNGKLDPGETCDDGNLQDGDGCSATCQTEDHYTCVGEPSVCTTPCGDGLIIGREECDDGGATPGDGCSDTCTIEPGWACAGLPSVCTAGCGDGVVGGSEQCDDGNTTVGDGCSVHCAYEPLCFVTNTYGVPTSYAGVTKITADGTITPISSVSMNEPGTGGSGIVACGRRVYLNLRSVIAGFDVGLDGALTPIPPLPLGQFEIGQAQRLLCSPDGSLLFALMPYGLFNGIIVSYAIDPVTGALTRVGDIATPSSVGGVFWADVHPTTGALFVASTYPQIMGFPQAAAFTRYTYDAAGHLAEAQREFVNNGFFVAADVRGLRFTADAGELVLMDFFDGTNSSFGQFNAPGAVFPPSSTMNKTFTSPRPHTPYGFAPRPEGGPIFYFQDGSLLYSAAFSGPSFSIQSSAPALGDGTHLLPAFDGNLLLQVLGDGADALATYTVAPDLVTVTPNTRAPVDPRPTSGVLMPCPAS